MTIPSTYKRNTTGGAFTTQKIGGVVIGITSATDTTDGQPVTEVSLLKDLFFFYPVYQKINLLNLYLKKVILIQYYLP